MPMNKSYKSTLVSKVKQWCLWEVWSITNKATGMMLRLNILANKLSLFYCNTVFSHNSGIALEMVVLVCKLLHHFSPD